ncbi:MAG: ATP-binding protein [Myxococcota bacterium]
MPLSDSILFVVSAALLGIYALGSELIERSPRWGRLGRNPVSYSLALGVYATTWTLFGSVGFAKSNGYEFLAIYVGVTLSCVAIPFLWQPLAELVDRYRLGSMADVLAFRYQSRTLGAIVTVFMVAGLLPYIALQLRAVAGGAAILVGHEPSEELGTIYALLLSAFAVVLGVRYADGRAHRPGLVATLAFESLFKLLAIVIVGGVVLFAYFGGVRGLNQYLVERPELVEAMTEPVMGDSWVALIFVTFSAAFLLPRQFFVGFVQRPGPRSLPTARYMLPLYLLVINLPVPVLYWAGRELAPPDMRPDAYVLAALASTPWAQVLAFLGAVSAASAMILVTSIALSGMVSNYLVPRFGASPESLLGRWAVFRRGTIIGVVVAGLMLHFTLPATRSLVDLGLASFVAVTHLLPGLVGTLFWRRATRSGVLAGLTVGALSWSVLTATPLFGIELDLSQAYALFGFSDASARGPAIWSGFAAHVLVFVAVSLMTSRTAEERNAAEACREPRVTRVLQVPNSPEALEERLASYVGREMALEEIGEAARAANVPWPTLDRRDLLQLVAELEGRLSERIGPLAARTYVHGGRPVSVDALAERLRAFRELDAMGIDPLQTSSAAHVARRYLSQLMAGLPVGVCTIDENEDVVIWNSELEHMSDLSEDQTSGHPVHELPNPWRLLFEELARDPSDAVVERQYEVESQVFELRAQTAMLPGDGGTGRVFVVEDLSSLRELERHVAHKDRLSSIGTLASGVAHEIGNPLTGILMVAKNLAEDPQANDAEERLNLIVDEARRIHGIVQGLLSFSRRAETRLALEDVPINATVHASVELAKLQTGGRIDLTLGPESITRATSDGLTQVLVNLLNNARQASPEGRPVTISTTAVGGEVRIDVEDHGDGVPAELADRIFEPFFTTKPQGKGTGLGLSVSRQILRRFGGSLSYAARGEGGSRFTVTLPSVEN